MVGVENRKLYGKRERGSKEFACHNLREVIDYRIKTAPNKALYTYSDYSTNSRTVIMPEEFKRQYQAVSTWLYENGYLKKHIAIIGDNSYQWLLAMQSILCSNNIVVPLDKNLEKEILSEFLKESDTDALFYSANYEQKAIAFKEELGIEIYKLDDIDNIVKAGSSLIEEGKTECFEREIDNVAPAIIIFTSGTTGKSKGVVLSQQNIVYNALLDTESIHFAFDVVMLLPFNHVYGFNTTNIPHILNGSTMHINQNIRYMFKDFQTENPEASCVVPMHLEVFYKTIWKNIREAGREEEIRKKIEENRKNLSITDEQKLEMFRDVTSVVLGNRIKIFAVSSAPLNVELYYGFKDFGIDIIQGYGCTECSPQITCNPPENNKPGSVGIILTEMEVKIDNPDENKEGEICARGHNIMLGYYKNEEATKEVIRDGWLHTCDLGYLDEDNYLYVSGRIKNLIILSNGENVSPEELEFKVQACHAVKEVVVYEKNKRIAAQIFVDEEYVIPEGYTDAEDYIRKFIAQINKDTTTYKQISIVEFRKTPFDRTSSQKIQRSSVE
jgi:long-chain acyl-CoA synthetase